MSKTAADAHQRDHQLFHLVELEGEIQFDEGEEQGRDETGNIAFEYIDDDDKDALFLADDTADICSACIMGTVFPDIDSHLFRDDQRRRNTSDDISGHHDNQNQCDKIENLHD